MKIRNENENTYAVDLLNLRCSQYILLKFKFFQQPSEQIYFLYVK